MNLGGNNSAHKSQPADAPHSYSHIQNSPQSPNTLRHQVYVQESHLNQMWVRPEVHFILRHNVSSAVLPVKQTSYLLPKFSGETGLEFTFPFQKWVGGSRMISD